MMAPETEVSDAQAFARKVFSLYTGGILTLMIQLGYKTGLFDVLAKAAGTSDEIAARAGLSERYVREWLGAVVTSGIVVYDAPSATYSLPPSHAVCLTGNNRLNIAPQSIVVSHLAKHLPRVTDAFRHGGGVPYAEFRPEFTDLMDDSWRRIYDETLLTGFLPAVPGLPDRLRSGVRVADVGCGTGHAVNLMAKEFSRSTFIGYDLAEDALAKATREAQAMELSNARFEVVDVVKLPGQPQFDVIFAFDSIHDQVDPAEVLRRINRALAPEGLFVMIDIKGTSNLQQDMSNPFAPFYYGLSTLHCLTVSLAHGGTGLGTMWGEQVARRMLADAGFTKVDVVHSPRPQNLVYVCRR